MQITNKQANYLPNPRTIAAIKWLLLVGCLVFIYIHWKEKSINISNIYFPDSYLLVFSIVLVLMVFNWYLEILRWKTSVSHITPITLYQAAEAVLGGLALNWIFPFTSGDLLARLARFKDKYQATSAAVLNRGIMLGLTVLLGLYGLRRMAILNDWDGYIFLVVLFALPIFRKIFRKYFDRFLIYFRALKVELLMKILFISILRYAVFVFQFYFLLQLFLPTIPADILIAGIGWIFLIRSSLPLFFGGMGVREASGLLFFESFAVSDQNIILPIFAIWVINTVLPSLIGLLFVWKFRLNIVR